MAQKYFLLYEKVKQGNLLNTLNANIMMVPISFPTHTFQIPTATGMDALWCTY